MSNGLVFYADQEDDFWRGKPPKLMITPTITSENSF